MSSVWDYSTTAASNTSASPNGAPEGMAPSGVNDSMREHMARSAGAMKAVTSSGTNTITCTPAPACAALVTGMAVRFIAGGTNTGAATFSPNGLTAKNLYKPGASGPAALTGGEIQTGQVVDCVYDGTEFVMTSAAPAYDRALSRVMSTTDVVNTTTETAIFSFSVPANTLGTTRALKLSLTGDYLNNSGSAANFELKVKFGATTIFDSGSGLLLMSASASRRLLIVDCVLSAQGATNAQVSRTEMTIGAAASAAGVSATANPTNDIFAKAVHNAVAEDSTAAKTLQVTITHGTAATTISGRILAATLELV